MGGHSSSLIHFVSDVEQVIFSARRRRALPLIATPERYGVQARNDKNEEVASLLASMGIGF